MIRRVLSAGLATLAALAASVALAAPAQAQDVGDGQLACNSGEICFRKDLNSNYHLKQFFYGAFHQGYNWTNAGGGLVDTVTDIRNRDTQCTVYLIDYGDFIEGRESFPLTRGATAYAYVGSDANDENNEHIRC